jgi:glutamate/tyrosine decarboxylase-like PLP-dependent enzyme
MYETQAALHELLRARGDLALDAARRGRAYLARVETLPASPSEDDVAALSALGGPMPEASSDPAEVLALLDTVGSPATVANAGGRYFGFVNGGALPASLAAGILAAAWDQNAALRAMSPVAAALEDIVLGWLRDLLQLPETAGGSLVSGASMANFTCIAAARHALLARQGWDVESQGLFGAPSLDVIVSEESHVSVRRALALAGLGRDRVRLAPADAQGRVRVERFPRPNRPSLICLQAGNVNTGASDPFAAICDIASDTESWVHVDGAFGLWAICSPARAHLVAGVQRADSWATDAHKWLNVPYDSGLAFVRHGGAVLAAMRLEASYLHAGAAREPMHWTPEASRRARGIEVWAALKSLGRTGVAELVDRTCRHAARFAAGLRGAGYEILNDVVLNQVLVAFGDRPTTEAVIAAVQREGTCWCGGTIWQGRSAMRISVSSWATTDEDVERSLDAIIRVAKAVGQGPSSPDVNTGLADPRSRS